MDPKSSAHRVGSNKGRGIGTSFDDTALGQMHSGSHSAGESQDQVNRVQDYGVSSVPLPATGDWGPEAVYSYSGGARSHPTAHTVDDRRHRPMGQEPGESFQYDHQGQGTYVKKTGTYIIGGGHQGQQGYSGDPSSNVASMRHVVKQQQQRTLGGLGGGASLPGTSQVLTPEGYKNIGSLQLGDQVISFNTSLSRNEIDEVIGQHVLIVTKEIVEISYDGGCVRCTYDHEIWSAKRNAYLTTDRLLFSDRVRLDEKRATAILSVVPQPQIEQKVFDITVKKNQNFYAREGNIGNPILVHNMAAATSGSSSSTGASGYKHEGDSPTSEVLTYKDNHASMGSNSTLGYAGKDTSQGTYYADTSHAHVRFTDGNVVWAENGGCFSTKPIQVKPFSHKVQSPPSGGSGGGGGGGGGGISDAEWEIDYQRRCRQFWWAKQVDRFKYGSMFVLAVLMTNYLMASFMGPDPKTFVNSTVQQIAARLGSSAVAGESQ